MTFQMRYKLWKYAICKTEAIAKRVFLLLPSTKLSATRKSNTTTKRSNRSIAKGGNGEPKVKETRVAVPQRVVEPMFMMKVTRLTQAVVHGACFEGFSESA